MSSCVWPADASRLCENVKRDVLDDGFVCPDGDVAGPSGRILPHPTYPHPEDCAKFYICKNGVVPQKGQCEPGTVYNEESFRCTEPEFVQGWWVFFFFFFKYSWPNFLRYIYIYTYRVTQNCIFLMTDSLTNLRSISQLYLSLIICQVFLLYVDNCSLTSLIVFQHFSLNIRISLLWKIRQIALYNKMQCFSEDYYKQKNWELENPRVPQLIAATCVMLIILLIGTINACDMHTYVKSLHDLCESDRPPRDELLPLSPFT